MLSTMSFWQSQDQHANPFRQQRLNDKAKYIAATAKYSVIGLTFTGLAVMWADIFWSISGQISGNYHGHSVKTYTSMPHTKAAMPVNASLLKQFDPFSRMITAPQQATTTAKPETNLDLSLIGVRVASEYGGAAIIKLPNGQQELFQIGDTIYSNAHLKAVKADHIILSRSGVEESLYMQGAQMTVINSTSLQAINANSSDQSPRSDTAVTLSQIRAFIQLAGLKPVADKTGAPTGNQGFKAIPAPAVRPLLEQAGIQSGDIITHINDIKLVNWERFEELEGRTPPAWTFAIIRDRRTINITINKDQLLSLGQ